jgi:Na+-driven multidrug efflux pump
MMNSIIRADGSPAWAMTSMLLGAITNIILDPVFIFGLGMGMTGAALATVIGQGMTFFVSFLYFFRLKTFKLGVDSFVPRPRDVGKVVSLGISTFITQLAIVIVAILCNMQFARYGAASEYGADIPIAVIGIQSKVFTVVINLIVGVVLGCQPIISYNMGACNYARVRELYKKIMVLTVTTGLVFTLLFECFPDLIIGMFGSPSNIPNIAEYWIFGKKTMRIFLSLIGVSCVVKMNSIFFQAVGKPLYAVVASTVRDMVCFVPLMFILPAISPDVELLLYAAPIADLLSLAATAGFSITFIRSLHKAEREMKYA